MSPGYGCTRARDQDLADSNVASAQPNQNPAIVQVGWIREHHAPDLPPYQYSTASYDGAGEITERALYRRDGTQAELHDFAAGRILRTTWFEPNGREPSLVRQFIYGEANRLVQIQMCSDAAPDCEPWGKDTVLTWTDAGLPLTRTSVRHGQLNRGTWKYDADGRLIEKTLGAVSWSYTYDGQGRLVASDMSAPGDDEGDRREYLYDDSGRLVRETKTGGFLPVHAVIEYSYVEQRKAGSGLRITGVEGIVY